MAKRRYPLPHLQMRHLAVRVLSWAAFLALAAGFAYWTRLAMLSQVTGTPEAAHPFDWYADGCLGVGLVLLAGLLLSRPAPTAARRKARIPQNTLPRNAKTAKRTRRHRVQ